MPVAGTPNTVPTPTGVGQSGPMTASFLSTLVFNQAGSQISALDRSFAPDLVSIYGNQNYTMLLEMLGKKETTENQTFYHYEDRGKLHAYVTVSAAGTGTGAGVAVTGISSTTVAGTYTPLRNGEIVENLNTNVQSRVSAVSRGATTTFTLTPLSSGDSAVVTNGDVLVFKGLADVGENSTKLDNIQNFVNKIQNTTTEIREDFEITDRAMMEKIEFAVDGQRFYRRKGTKDAERRFLNNIEDKLVFGIPITQTTLYNSGLYGTAGLINQIAARGSKYTYVNGTALTWSDFQFVTRQMDVNGSASELHWLADVYQFQKIQRDLFSQFQQGAIIWDSVGGSQDAAARLGFKSLALDGYNIHFKKYAPFTPEWKYGIQSPGGATPTYNYHNYGVVIPQGTARDPKLGSANHTISIVSQPIPGIGEINAYEWGGLAPSNKDGQMHVVNTMITYKGLRVRGANQCVIFDGATT